MKSNRIILDGAMGTMLQAAGLRPGEKPEVFGFFHPEIVESVHRRYLEAGSTVLYTNTFGANARKLAGSGLSAGQVVESAVRTAAKAAADHAADKLQKQEESRLGAVKIALDVGPVGELLEPFGTVSFEEAYDIYAEVMKAGASAGADLIVIETFTDLYDAKAALLAAKENTDLPVWVTMSFEAGGRTFTGTTVSAMALTLGGLGADALGINCSLGPEEIFPLALELAEWTDLPLIVKPNAGLPDPSTGLYSLDAESFGREMRPYAALPVMAMGGCCGTGPEYIESLIKNIEQSCSEEEKLCDWRACRTGEGPRRGVCSSVRTAEWGGVRVIGERLNPTGKKRFAQALREHDMDYICRVALQEEDAGADILDVNVGVPGEDECALMRETVKALQAVVSLPLQIDSSDPEAIEAGLRVYKGRAIVNSVNAETEVLDQILPVVKKYGAAVIGLTIDERGIPDSAAMRVENAGKILAKALQYGIPKEDLIIDCLTLTVSAQQDQARETLRAVRTVSEEMGLHCALGVSNISFGLPERNHITENFLIQAMNSGLDFPIINPNVKEMMDAVVSFRVLSGEDQGCTSYIQRFADEKSAEPEGNPSGPGDSAASAGSSYGADAQSGAPDIREAVLKGLREQAGACAEALLKDHAELEIVNNYLIPALDEVGEKYERGILFLPQLINAANAACAAFDLIRARIAKRGGESISKGTILVATVRGDVHDIGKNIVKVVLENYGYRVIDLGRDVPAEKVVETTLRENVRLVGLSALMTTTLPAMAETIQALRKVQADCRIFVGGAVLTPQYAEEIGADYYAADARASVEIAKEVFEQKTGK